MALKYARDLKAIPQPSSLGELCNCGMSLESVVAFCNGTDNKEMEQNPCGSIHMRKKTLQVLCFKSLHLCN